MTIKQLSEDKVLIRLCADDMKKFAEFIKDYGDIELINSFFLFNFARLLYGNY